MRTALLALTFAIAVAAAETINFDSAKAGPPPAGWSVAMTHQGGPPKWEILKDDSAPSKPNVLAQTSGDPTAGRFPLCIYDKASFKDGEVSIRFKAVAGKVDQSGGIVWRYQDENNYYLVRGNALGNNIVLYKVENGKRIRLVEVKHPVPSQTWIKLGVSFQGKLFTVTFDDKKLLEVEDNTFTQAGKIGLWTKSDSVTYFDDLAISLMDCALADEPPSQPAYGIRRAEVWIPMKDGVRLSAYLFMPDGAEPSDRFPVLLEYLPYRKDERVAEVHDAYTYFVRRGYVGAHVEIRGTGRSEGRPPDREYSEQEQLDGMEVIAWLSRQPWCNGKVGMWGISWGGFNSIQLAMRRPPALKAIIAIMATDEIYHDDIHFVDGMMHLDTYELFMDLQPSMSPGPEYSIGEDILRLRFENPPWSLLYKRHQRDGPFWRRGSLRPRYDAIQVPSFLIGGWLDAYRSSIPRMMQNMSAPVKALIGPWTHALPHVAVPGPAIEWRHDAVRWWDLWLKGRDTGIMREPRFAFYERYWYPPDPSLKMIPGEWRSEDAWPPKGLKEANLFLQANHSLADSSPAIDIHQLAYVPSAGIQAGTWWGDLQPDQRPGDAFSLVYDSEPVREDLSILGFPRVLLRASATAPLAHWIVRLCDVAPDGAVTLITGGGLNGAQRESATDPRPLEPGKMYSLELNMHLTSWVFSKGHRIRLAVSNALWPMIWPTPHPMKTRVQIGGELASHLVLPIIPRNSRARPSFPPAEPFEGLPGIRSASQDRWKGPRVITQDVLNQSTTVTFRRDWSTEHPWGSLTRTGRLSFTVRDSHPEAASVTGEAQEVVKLEDHEIVWRGLLDLRSDAINFYYKYKRELYRDGTLIREKAWDEVIPRDYQ